MPRFQPVPPSASWSWATVEAISDGKADLLFGVDGDATSVPVHGEPPAVGSRVLVLLQGASALVLGKSGTPPRWRGRMNPHTVPAGAVTRLTSLGSEFVADRITFNNGLFTVTEPGVYAVSWQGDFGGITVTETTRVFGEINMGGNIYRQNVGYAENSGSVAAISGMSAGATFFVEVYQTSTTTATLTGNAIHAVKISEL